MSLFPSELFKIPEDTMCVRDQFAISIISAILTATPDSPMPDPAELWEPTGVTFADHVAKTAYQFANAMMKARCE